MRAIIFEGVERVAVTEVPDPAVRESTDVVVRVTASAVCGSDLHVYHGRETGLDPGTVMGHEFTGEITEIGADVRTLAVGERVAGPFTTSCGDCFYCRRALTCRCERGELFGWVENGRGLNGTQAELLRVPLADSSLVAVERDLPAEVALLLGDVLPTGFYCADMAAVSAGDVCAVLGCGPVGLAAVLGARDRGAETVLAVDPLPARRARAEELGAIGVAGARDELLEIMRAHTGGRGVDAVLEAVGSPEAARLAVDIVRPGGVVAAAGVHNEEVFAFRPVEAYDRNLTYRTGRCPARAYMERLLPLARRRAEELASLFTHRRSLAEGVDAYALFSERRDGCVKVLLEP